MSRARTPLVLERGVHPTAHGADATGAAKLQELAARLRAAGLCCDAAAVREATELKGMFNAIDPTTGWKIDFIVLKNQAFNRE